MVYNQNFQPQQFNNGQLQNVQQISPLNYQGITGYNYIPQNQHNAQSMQTQHQQAVNQQYPFVQNSNYSPNLYQNNYNQNNQTTTNQVWVQGEAGAKAYPVGAGNTVMLMDSENSVFYIKSTDVNGVPLPLRTFEYNERINQVNQPMNSVDVKNNVDNKDYITRDEFEKRLSELNIGKEERGNKNESTVQSSKRTEQSTKQQYNKHNATV